MKYKYIEHLKQKLLVLQNNFLSEERELYKIKKTFYVFPSLGKTYHMKMFIPKKVKFRNSLIPLMFV